MQVMQAETAKEQLSVTYPISAFTMHEILKFNQHDSSWQPFSELYADQRFIKEEYFVCFLVYISQGRALACSAD